MKTLFICTLLVFVTRTVYCDDVTPAQIQTATQECTNEWGLTFEEWHNNPTSDDPKAKCFSACFMKKMDLMIDGKIVKDKGIEMYTKFHQDADDASKQKVIACIDKANEQTDECEVASVLAKCKFDAKIN